MMDYLIVKAVLYATKNITTKTESVA